MSEEARWPITLGGLYYGVLPKASHGELCPSPFVVIDLEPAPTQRAGIYQRAIDPGRFRTSPSSTEV
ncbi:hypothetical protein ACHAXT_002673 [Thalassiosira profunda]